MKKLFFLFVALLITNSSLFCQQEVLKNSEFNILFIGNSLTYTNNLPALVKEICKTKRNRS